LSAANCTFSDNTAQAGNSTAAGPSRTENGNDGSPGGHGYGGAICNVLLCVLTNCTFSNDRVVGGSGGDGGTGTYRAGDGGNGGTAGGGALYNSSSLTVVNCTLAGCGASGGTNGFAGSAPFGGIDGIPGLSSGGALYNATGTLILRGSILSTNSPGGNGSGFITDTGYNLSSDSSFTLGSASLSSTDPKILALADNGGPTKTFALSSSSPAHELLRRHWVGRV
jgi:hypothetical protein